jgi:hypothetical protein
MKVLFALPLTIACIGVLLMLLMLIVLISLCCGKENPSIKMAKKNTAVGGVVQTDTLPNPATTTDHGDVSRMNVWSAYRFMNCNDGCARPAPPPVNYSSPSQGVTYYHIGGQGVPNRCQNFVPQGARLYSGMQNYKCCHN